MSNVNAPLTTWNPTNGNGEPVTVGAAFLVDELGAFLVDELGASLVDTGINFQSIPLTAWTQNDGS